MIHYQNGWSVPEAFGAVLTIVTRLPPPHTQGEVSLQGAIVGMAQNYVGSNNINLLLPNGQFGECSEVFCGVLRCSKVL